MQNKYSLCILIIFLLSSGGFLVWHNSELADIHFNAVEQVIKINKISETQDVVDDNDIDTQIVVNEVVNEDKVEEKFKSVEDLENQEQITNQVPFTSQDPTGKWTDIRLKSGCEEASVYMAMKWVNDGSISNPDQTTTDLLALADFAFAKDATNDHHDFSVYDIVKIMFNDYYSYSKAQVITDFTIADIIKYLEQGNIILTPTYGRDLGNPHFTAPGPEQHMLVITGYDYDSAEFITNDPGTRHGQNYHYDEDVLYNAIRYYSTGPNSVFTQQKVMIIVSK